MKNHDVIHTSTHTYGYTQAQTAGLVAAAEELRTAVASIDEEIAALEAALRAKREEKARLSEGLAEAEASVGEARAGFDRRLGVLRGKARALQAALAECDHEAAGLAERRRLHERAAERRVTEAGRRRAVVEAVEGERAVAAALAAAFAVGSCVRVCVCACMLVCVHVCVCHPPLPVIGVL